MKQILFPFKNWDQPEFYRDSILVDSLRIELNLAISKNPQTGDSVTALVSDLSATDAKRYAYFELLKKISILQLMPQVHRLQTKNNAKKMIDFYLKNGVAIHFRKARACENAKLELIERDRVLRSWFGQCKPTMISGVASSFDHKISNIYSISYYTIKLNPSDPYTTIGYFGFPKDPDLHPLFFGFGSATALEAACKKASHAAIQNLGRAWNKQSSSQPSPLDPTSQQQQEYFLLPSNHQKIKDWLDGKSSNNEYGLKAELVPLKNMQMNFFDITPAEFNKKFFVIKAESLQTIPFWFGKPDGFIKTAMPDLFI